MSRAEQLKAKAEALKAKKEQAERRRAGDKPRPPVPAGTDTVTPEDRDRHLGPAVPHAKPVRSTVDLAPIRHAGLKAWCGETAVMIGRSRVTTQDVFRVLVDRLLTDETLARKVRHDLRSQ
jgi:hypothetical protein